MSMSAPRILIVDDEEIVRESLSGWLEKDGYEVSTAPDGPSGLEKLRTGGWSILLVDLKMPGMDGLQVLEEAKRLQPDISAVIMTAYATVDTAVTAMKIGAYDYLVKPFDPEELSALVQRIVSQRALVRENESLRRALKLEYGFHDLVSKSPSMQRVFDLARVAARSASTILVLGESGSGKEVLARAIHAESPRVGGPFVAISCVDIVLSLTSCSSAWTSAAPSSEPSKRSTLAASKPAETATWMSCGRSEKCAPSQKYARKNASITASCTPSLPASQITRCESKVLGMIDCKSNRNSIPTVLPTSANRASFAWQRSQSPNFCRRYSFRSMPWGGISGMS